MEQMVFYIHLRCEAIAPYERLFNEILGGQLEEGKRRSLATFHSSGERQWVDIGFIGKSEGSITFATTYGLTGVPIPPTALPKLEPAIRAISDAGLKFSTVTDALFVYEEGMSRSVIALPIEMFRPHKATLFDTIEGVQVVRSPRSPGESRFVIDISVDPEDQELVHNIRITGGRTITRGFESDLLKIARDISREFLVDEG